MRPSHVTGGVIGGLLGAAFAGLAHHYGLTSLSETDAALVGAGAVAAGVAAAHAIWNIGLGPIFARIAHGPKPPATPGA